MSGSSFDATCPNCRDTVNAYSDWKPYDYTSIGPCLNCGFYTVVKEKYLSLSDLNYEREQHNEMNGYREEDEDFLKPLTHETRPKKDF